MAPADFTVSTDPPDGHARATITALAEQIEHADGAPPLSDQALAQLDSSAVDHVTVSDADAVVGYAQRAGDSLELVGETGALATLLDAAARPGVHVWSHGSRSRLVPLFEQRGFTRERDLHQLRRPLDADHLLPADPPLADGVVVRDFVPGRDDDAWLAVNAAAFAHHPEQGRWTHADLEARIDADWFEAAGFLLAWRGDALLGFHWTKVHPDHAGEVYVLGVDPSAQGLGLGHALLTRGLHHLADRTCPYVLLYVDGDNPGAIRLYEQAGFTKYDLDVQWTAPG